MRVSMPKGCRHDEARSDAEGGSLLRPRTGSLGGLGSMSQAERLCRMLIASVVERNRSAMSTERRQGILQGAEVQSRLVEE